MLLLYFSTKKFPSMTFNFCRVLFRMQKSNNWFAFQPCTTFLDPGFDLYFLIIWIINKKGWEHFELSVFQDICYCCFTNEKFTLQVTNDLASLSTSMEAVVRNHWRIVNESSTEKYFRHPSDEKNSFSYQKP